MCRRPPTERVCVEILRLFDILHTIYQKRAKFAALVRRGLDIAQKVAAFVGCCLGKGLDVKVLATFTERCLGSYDGEV